MSIMTSPQKHPTSGIYYFRQSVPKECRSAIGKTEFKNSLGTKNLSEAKRLIIQFMHEADQLVALARLKLDEANSPHVNDNSSKLSKMDCQIIANRWYARIRDELKASDNYSEFLTYEMDDDGNEHAFGLSDTLCVDADVILTPNVNRLKGSKHLPKASEEELRELSIELSEYIDSQLTIEGIAVSYSSKDYIVLAEAFYKHLKGLERLCLSRHKSNWNDEPVSLTLSREPLSVQVNLNETSGSGVNGKTSISAIYEQYRESSILNDRDNQSALKKLDQTRSQVARFVAILGDMDIKSITKRDLTRYRDILLQLPKNKSKSIRDKTVAEQIKLAEANGLARITSTTARNSIKQLSLVFTYAWRELDLIPVNPTFGMQLKSVKKQMEADDTGKGYSQEDLRMVFSHEIFTDNSFKLTYGQACYWIPLLCRYTGARLNEIAQLTQSDIECREGGIYCIHINRVDDKSVKNNPSVRRVPLSEHIIELGFLDFVKRSKGQLFSEVPKGKYGARSDTFSGWWSKRVNSTGVSTTNPSHAFRHSFKTDMRTLGVADSVSDAITGHSPSNEGASYGLVTLATQKAAIDKLSRLDIIRIYK
jgi:integrase